MLEVFRRLKVFGERVERDYWLENGFLTKIEESSIGLPAPPGALIHSEGAGLEILPSGVDVQVHLRVPGQSEKERPEGGLQAALHGGYGALLSMPNTRPTIDCPEVLRMALETVKKPSQDTGITTLFCCSVSRSLEGKELSPLLEMARAGAAAFTDDGKAIEPESFMRAAFRASAETGLPVLQHAEWSGHGGVLAEGPVQKKFKLKAYDRKEEWSIVERDLKLLEEFPGARYHVLHVTTRESLNFIRRAKELGLKVSAEVSPHHLYFCTQDIDPANSSFKMNPPLHQAEDREALRRALNEGLLDFVATDHAPHEASVKGTDFAKAAFGTLGLESSLRVLLTGVHQGWLRPSRLAEIFSAAPARFLGLGAEYGQIAVGRPFRAVIFDSTTEERFRLEDLKGIAQNSCFLGTSLRGHILGHYTKSGYKKLTIK